MFLLGLLCTRPSTTSPCVASVAYAAVAMFSDGDLPPCHAKLTVVIRGRSCKGILAYAGLQRAVGQEPRCLGYRTALPPNIIITEEDVGE